jgi:integrase
MLAYSRTEFDPVLVRHLMPDQIGRWLNNLPVGTKTRQHALAAMRQVLSAGVVWGYLEVGPARPEAVKAPPSMAPDVRPFESWDEVHAVAGRAREFGPLIRFACATRLRPEKWIALQWNDIDTAARTCRVHRTFTAGTLSRDAKTAAGLRSVALQAAALEALADLPRPLRASQLVFPGARGGHLNLGNLRRRCLVPGARRGRAGTAAAVPDAAQVRHAGAGGGRTNRVGQPSDGTSRHPNHAAVLRGSYPR